MKKVLIIAVIAVLFCFYFFAPELNIWLKIIILYLILLMWIIKEMKNALMECSFCYKIFDKSKIITVKSDKDIFFRCDNDQCIKRAEKSGYKSAQ